MSDPRERLDRCTLTNVYTEDWADAGTLYARTTKTPLDQDRLVEAEGLRQPQSQAPTTEGEIVILYQREFGISTAQAFVTVNIDGSLEWKAVLKRTGYIDVNTGLPF